MGIKDILIFYLQIKKNNTHMASFIIPSPSGPPPVPKFQPVLPDGLGNNLSGGAARILAPITAPRPMDTSKTVSTLVTETLVASYPSEAVNNYEVAPLFVERGEADRPPTVWAHWDLNSALRAYSFDRSVKRKGKQGTERMPITINEFMKRFTFAGFQIGSVQQNPAGNDVRFKTTHRAFAIQIAGELHNYPNIWGEAARAGWDVGFQVCYVDMVGREAATRRDWKGNRDEIPDDYTPDEMRVLQVVPIVCKGGNVPFETLPLAKEKYDFHSNETKTLKFKIGDDVVEEKFEFRQSAAFIPVGRVLRVMGKASDFAVKEACITSTGYQKLLIARSQIDIQMAPHAKNEKWVC